MEDGIAATSLPTSPVSLVEAPGFDLEGYIARYTGHTKLVRLELIAQCCPALEERAYALLAKELRGGVNTEMYRKHAARLCGLVSAGWADEEDARSLAMFDRLEADLSAARASMAKDPARIAYAELGDFLHRRGDLNGALKYLLRTRDYCSSQRQLVEDCVKVCVVAMDAGNMVQVTSHLAKAEHGLGGMGGGGGSSSSGSSSLSAGGGGGDAVVGAQLAALGALVLLKTRQYKQAARKFAEVGELLGGSLSAVLSLEDVAVYGALCGLAELDREELQRVVVDSRHGLLDLAPAFRDLTRDVHECRFGKALAALDGLKGSLRLDVHLKDHASALLGAIKDRCVVQYFEPFLSASLSSMAAALGCSVAEMEAHAARLVMDGKLAARVDSEAKTLHVRTEESRAECYRRVGKLGGAYLGDMRLLLLRMSCVEHDLVVKRKPPPSLSIASAYGPSGGAGGQYLSDFSGNQQGDELADLLESGDMDD